MTGGWSHTLLQNPVPGDVVKCLQELGIEVYKVDNEEAQAPCPAHYERTGKERSRGDWSVSTDDGQHNCFSCGFSGTFVTLVSYVLSCSRQEAIEWIKARGSIDRARRLLGRGVYVDELVADKVTEADLALYTDVPEEVCESRNIEPAAADTYRVLWDPQHQLWITCIREYETDRLIGWQEKKKRYFRNHPEHMEKSDHLFGINDVPETCTTGVLVESPLDCAYILSAGVMGAVSSMGAKVSDRQLDILCERFDTLVSALDDDESGDEVNATLRKRVGGRARLRFWNYGRTDAKDPGEQSYAEVCESYKTAYSAILARW